MELLDAEIVFNDRCTETDLYFNFLLDIIDKKASLLFRGTTDPIPINQDLVKNLKANSVLLLYNLVESTVRNYIHAIHTAMNQERIPLEDIHEILRKRILNEFKANGKKDFHIRMASLSHDIILESFDEEKICSGNIDARAIRKIANEYGFTKTNSNGDSLLTVKSGRNDLAHGRLSFSEYGQNLSIDELVRLKSEIIVYLQSMTHSIKDYINDQSYLSQRAL